jgi:hypothetical protein
MKIKPNKIFCRPNNGFSKITSQNTCLISVLSKEVKTLADTVLCYIRLPSGQHDYEQDKSQNSVAFLHMRNSYNHAPECGYT